MTIKPTVGKGGSSQAQSALKPSPDGVFSPAPSGRGLKKLLNRPKSMTEKVDAKGMIGGVGLGVGAFDGCGNG